MRRFARKFHSNFQIPTNHQSGLEFDYCCSDAQNRCLALFMLCSLTSEFLLSAFLKRDPLADHNFVMIQLIFAIFGLTSGSIFDCSRSLKAIVERPQQICVNISDLKSFTSSEIVLRSCLICIQVQAGLTSGAVLDCSRSLKAIVKRVCS